MMDILIRPVDRHDLPEVRDRIACLAAHHGDSAAVTVAQLRRDLFGLTPWMRMLVADRDGVVGYAALCQRIKLGDGLRGMEIEHLFVDEMLRGQGLGRRMLAAAETLAHRLGGEFVTIGTHPENAAARAVYRACGYEAAAADPNRFRKRLAVDAVAV